ncbi:MAG TPA: transketolase [Candidatus Nanoarchaeia archaeon]|nr:transketolase [Candidatus Nanoarchaeia archaeon]
MNVKELKILAAVLRGDVLRMTTAAGSGHLTSCLSSAELVSCLFFNEMKFDISNPFYAENDEFILSKGHAAPLLYAALYRAGCVRESLEGLRKKDSVFEGHPLPRSVSWVKVATGSLGQGLGAGVGMALAAKKQRKGYRVYVLCGDSELSEGSNYEALQLAAYLGLDNLCLILDVNKLGQRGVTMLGYDTNRYKERIESFGWVATIVDGHSVEQITSALSDIHKSKKPSVIIAKTIKGKGITMLEGKGGWHGKALSKREAARVGKLFGVPVPKIEIQKPHLFGVEGTIKKIVDFASYRDGEEVSTREAYGDSIASLAFSDPSLLVLDAEVSNSTFAERVQKKTPTQFVECYIAEQNMISMALGLSVKGHKVFASTFAAFLSRAHDQLRMAAYSSGNFTVCGSHAGVSIGEDGVSQMGLEDIALFRGLPGSSIFYPSDAVSTQKLTQLSNQLSGIRYIRTTRGATSVIYGSREQFELGDFKVIRESVGDKAVLVGAGVTLHEALKAHDDLKFHRLPVSVIDLYCIKPFKARKFIEFVKRHGNLVIVSEDHYAEGGIGEMLSAATQGSGIEIVSLAVSGVPHSATSEELLRIHRIDAAAMKEEVLKRVKIEIMEELKKGKKAGKKKKR